MNSGFLLGSAGVVSDGIAAFAGPDLTQRLFIPAANSYLNATFTVELWAYLFALETLGNTCVFSNADSVAHRGAEIFLLSTLRWQVNIGNGTAYVNINPAGAVTTYAWHHVVLTYDGTTAKLYDQGVLVGSTLVAFAPTVNTGLNFNGSSTSTGATSFSRALYTELAIYPTALSSVDVTNHFNGGTLRNTIPLFRSPPIGGSVLDNAGLPVDLSSVLNAVRHTF